MVRVEVRRRHDKEAVLLLLADKRLQFAIKPWLRHGVQPGLPGEMRDPSCAPDIAWRALVAKPQGPGTMDDRQEIGEVEGVPLLGVGF
jgi:hypothetical protein